MRRVGKGFSGVKTPIFERMLAVRDVAEEAEAQVPAQGYCYQYTYSCCKPKILNITAAPVVPTRRRKGVVIRDPEEELLSDTPIETPKVKDKGKGILIEAPKPMKKK
nr:hypothetical protein [Tanacetum cinerariifolium]